MLRIDSIEIIDYYNHLPKEVIIKQISGIRNKSNNNNNKQKAKHTNKNLEMQ